MDWLQRIGALVNDLIVDHWVKALVALAIAGAGWSWGRYRARESWRRREFLNRFNVSLNLIDDGVLRIRTLSEQPLEKVFLNSAAAKLVARAARKTTEDDPVLPLAEADRWFVYNEVLNQISEQFAQGHLRRSLGVAVTGARYVIALTCERAGGVRTQKIRAMVIRRDLLSALPEQPPRFESSTHVTRFDTLRTLAARLDGDPGAFLEVELCL